MMNRLRSHKLKLNNGFDSVNNNNVNNSNSNNNSNNNYNNNNGNTNNQSNNPITGYYGLFNKLSKRYSTLSNKIRGRSPKRRSTSAALASSSSCKAAQSAKTLCGSYNMTGSHSEDHRLEIGAPILISSTTLDADRFDVSEERLKMIGGGIAATSCGTLMKLKPLRELTNNQTNNQVTMATTTAIQQSSSGSENEVYVDACSSSVTMPANELHRHNDDHDQLNNECNELTYSTPNRLMNHYNSNDIVDVKDNFVDITDENSTNNLSPPVQFTKSLHRSELKVFLQKSNNANATTSPIDNTTNRDSLDDLDIPKLPELYGSLSISHSNEVHEEMDEVYNEEDHDADKENSSPSMIGGGDSKQSKSEPNTPLYDAAESKMIMNCFLVKQKRYQSAETLIQRKKKKRRSVAFSSTNSINQNNHRNRYDQSQFAQAIYMNGSKNSLLSPIINYDDYDLKSVSCQSLNVQSLFVSIDELNEITQQINETEESFNEAIDFEYCLHRDQLKPSERRITLLKNKNTTLINLMHNKEKLKKSWGDMKHWIGEEGAKLRDVVQRQPLVQRVGSSKLNINQTDVQCRRRRCSPSANGSVMLRNVIGVNSSTLQSNPGQTEIDDTLPTQNVIINSTFSLNCSEIVNDTNPNETPCDNLDEDNVDNNIDDNELLSPVVKKIRQEGQNGFEELRRYVKQGGDFGKELVLILQERIDSEQLYSKSLSKMANKLNKACRELPGSIADAWRSVATEMESRSDIHRQLSASLNDEIVKPLKAIVDSHHKSRKSVESTVDKASRVLAEWRASEAKSKKSSHAAARENEKLQDAMLDVRIQKSPSIALLHQGSNKLAVEKEIKSAEKDCAKLDSKRKKAEEAVKRADVEYYTLCVRAERARVDWEMAVLRGSTLLQTVENQRLINMKNFVSHYTRLTSNMNPIVEGVIQRLQPQVDACNVIKDMQIVKNIRRNAEGPSEQLLPDFYCEHTTLAMNRERRKHALIKLLQLVKTDLERERRSRNGLKNLSQTLTSQENQNVADKLYHIRSMLTYLEGARFKLQSALLELDHKPRTSHPLAQHIQITRDRTGLQQSVLKVPLWLKNNEKINTNGCNYDDCNEYECISSPNTTISTTNISCLETSSTSGHSDTMLKHFNRSKSNIETLSTHTEILVNGTATIAAPAPPVLPPQTTVTTTTTKLSQMKAKTLDFHHHNNNNNNRNVDCTDRGQADGGSNQQDSDFDEFSSQDGDDCDDNGQTLLQDGTGGGGGGGGKGNIEKNSATATALGGIIHVQCPTNYYQNTSDIQQNQNHNQNDCYSNTLQLSQSPMQTSSASASAIVLSRCKALYSYTPKLYDELELTPGDIIEVHAKQEDGWWLGALRNQIGIFPATYVEEFV